jgi:hypothetical protein
MNPMKTLSLFLAALLVGLSAMTAPARAEVPDVLDLASAEAEVIIVAPNLASASKKISQFVQALGFKDIPEMADPLGSLKKQLGVTKGLNESGSLLVAMTGIVAAAHGGGEPDVALLIPVSSYKDFVGNFEGKDEDGVTVLSMPHGEPGFARSVGNYAVMGPKKETIARFKAGNGKAALSKAAGVIGSKALTSNDLSVYINMNVLGKQLRPLLKQARDEAANEFGAVEAAAPAGIVDIIKGVMNVSFDSLDAVLRDGDSIIFGADLTTKGVGFTATVQFREGSALAAMFPGGKGNAAGMTAMLPNNPYLMATAMDLKGIDLKSLADEFANRMPKNGWVADMIKTSTALIPNTKRTAVVYLAPANAASLVTGMSTVTVVDTTDGKAFGKATKSYFDSLSKIRVDLGEVEGLKMNFGFQTTFKENALSPEASANVGAKVDEYSLKLDIPKELTDQVGDAGNMVGLLTKTAGYVATVDKTVLTTTTIDVNLLKVGVEAVKKGNGIGSTALVKQVRESGLPADANFEAFVSVGSIVGVFNQFSALAQMFDVPNLPEIPQLEVPNNLPPLAMGGQVDSGGISARFYIPMPVINWVKDTAMKMQGGEAAPRDPNAKPAPF